MKNGINGEVGERWGVGERWEVGRRWEVGERWDIDRKEFAGPPYFDELPLFVLKIK